MRKSTAYLCLGIALLLFLKGVFPAVLHPPEEPNLYTLQAEAFLHGSWDIGTEVHDVAFYQGHYYVAFPPFPAVLLLPFVWVFGATYANPAAISLALTGLNVWLLLKILQGQGVARDTALWMTVGFFMGTAYWLAAKGSNGIWFFAHIVAVTALLLSIYEALGKGRGWLVGIYFAAAVLSRHMTAYALPFLLCALWENKERRLPLLGVCTGLLGAVAVYLSINWIRFGDPLDMGYDYILQTGYLKARLESDGLFHINYFPFNFIYLFLQGFHVQFSGETLLKIHCLDPFGTSLTFASPFLFTAFLAKWKRDLQISAWASIALMVTHMLFYYTNGYYQVNAQRFTLDFMPLLILLAALGAQRCHPRIWKSLIVYSVALNILASIICSFQP